MGEIRKFAAACLAACVLPGCALPLAVTVATSVAQLAITAATGKGPTDHLVSLAMMKDCVLFRIVEGEEVCIDAPDEALIQRPDGVYMRIDHADGSREIAPVIQIQPVYAYNEMPRQTNAQDVIDAIRGTRRPSTAGGVIYQDVSGLPDIH